MEDGDLGTAVEANAVEAADAAVDVEVAALPAVETGDEAGIADDGPLIGINEGEADLVAVGVSGEEEVPGVGGEGGFRIGIVGEDDGGRGGGHRFKGGAGVEVSAPEVGESGEVESGELGGGVLEEVDFALGEDAFDGAGVVGGEAAFEPLTAVVVAEDGEGGNAAREGAEEFGISGIMSEVGSIDVVAGEADQVGLLGEGEFGDVSEVVERDQGRVVEIGQLDQAKGLGEAGKGDPVMGDFDAPAFDAGGIESGGSEDTEGTEEETAALHPGLIVRRGFSLSVRGAGWWRPRRVRRGGGGGRRSRGGN